MAPQDCVSLYFMSDLIASKKMFIKNLGKVDYY